MAKGTARTRGGEARQGVALASAPVTAPAEGRFTAFIETYAGPLLALLILAYTVLFSVLNWYRIRTLRQGFDFLVYEQPIWNTVHGRPFEQSMYSFSTTHLGVDLALFELWIAPFYAIWQLPMTLFVLISLGAGLGAWPLFLIARERFSSALIGLGWALLYLIFLPIGTITLAEFQPRLFAASALLGAYWFYRRQRAIPFWICLLIALTVRSDVGLVVGTFGLYALLERRDARFGVIPAIVGFGYWLVAVFLIIPALANGHGFLWQVNYTWLGENTRAIVTTVVTHPLYTAQGVFTLEKGRYLAQLLWPLAFLPLLRPRLLLIPAPILILNLLSGELVQFDLFHQYQALIIPFLFIGAIEGLAILRASEGTARLWRLGVLGVAAIVATVLLLPIWPGSADDRNGLHPTIRPLLWLTLLALLLAPFAIGAILRRWPRAATALPLTLGGLVVLMLLQQLALGSDLLRFLKNPHASPRLAAAQEIIALVPADAPLAVTSQLGIQVPMRRYLYHFPGNSSYDPALVARAAYVIGDRQRDDGREAGDIDALVKSGRWQIVADRDDFVLLRQIP
jgi:uncharacterized membrane protein